MSEGKYEALKRIREQIKEKSIIEYGYNIEEEMIEIIYRIEQLEKVSFNKNKGINER